MNCPACTSPENRVMTTKPGEEKIGRLRCCSACGHRWTTVEMAQHSLQHMESAVKAVRAFHSLSKEFEDAEATHS